MIMPLYSATPRCTTPQQTFERTVSWLTSGSQRQSSSPVRASTAKTMLQLVIPYRAPFQTQRGGFLGSAARPHVIGPCESKPVHIAGVDPIEAAIAGLFGVEAVTQPFFPRRARIPERLIIDRLGLPAAGDPGNQGQSHQ